MAAGSVYDHMLAVILVGTVFVAAVGVLPNVGYVGFLSVDQQQLRNLALDVANTMLLDSGYPARWGSIQAFSDSVVQRFGLALDSGSSFYVLDPDKVSRLVTDNPAGSISYEAIRSRLGLQGYAFIFRIMPLFNVSIHGNDPSVTVLDVIQGVDVVVTQNDGSPIPNAFVDASIMYVKGKDDDNVYRSRASNLTNALGKCVIRDQSLPSEVTFFVIVFNVTVADLATVTASYTEGLHQDVLQASVIGDNVTLQIPRLAMPGDNNNTKGERWVEEITAVGENGVSSFYDGSHQTDPINYGSGSDKYIWSRVFPGLSLDTPMFLIFTINVPLKKEAGEIKPGRQLVLMLGPNPNWKGIRVQAYGDQSGLRGATSAVKIQRNVIISRMTFIAELIMWKQ